MENKVNYKLFFSDLDHTLLVKNHIPDFNLEAIKKAKEKGVKFVLCTARSYRLMSQFLKELETENAENEYTVCNSGSTIYENKDQKLIYLNEIDKETLKLVFEFGKKFEISIIFNTLDKSYKYGEEKERKRPESQEYKEIFRTFKGFKHEKLNDLDELKDIKVIRVLFACKDYEYLLNVYNELKKEKNLEGKIFCNMSGKTMIEINSLGVSKGAALKWLSNYLKIDTKETIAIGDDYSDEPMIKEAGLGCAVKSAHEPLKKIAKYVCEKDYFEGSVKEVIEKFILNKI